MSTVAVAQSDNPIAELDSMLADLEIGGVNPDGSAMMAEEVIVDDGDASGVVAGSTENVVGDETTEEAAQAVTPKSKGKGKKAAAKPAVEAKKEEPKPPKERTFFKNKAERLQHNLGNDFATAMVLEKADQKLVDQALATKQAETLAAIMGAGVKVQTRITFVLEFVMGKSAKLNEVMKMALAALKKDGSISSAADGTFMKAMFAQYSQNSAKAMGNNTLLALKALKIIKANEAKGKFDANSESLILDKLAKLGVY